MRANHAIAAIAISGLLAVGSILYSQPENLAPESGLGLDATAEPSAPKQRRIREAQLAPPEQREQAPQPAAERGPASVESAPIGKTFRVSFKSPYRVLETLLTRDAPVGSDGSRFRTQIVRTGFKYPLIRIESRVSAAGGMMATREMVADHVLVQLQSGATRQDLEELLSRQGFTATIRRAAHTPGLFLVAFDGTDLTAMERVMRSLGSDSHVVARTEPDLIVRAF